MKKWAVLASLLIAGCASQALPGEKDDALNRLVGCMFAKGQLLDDGRSDPYSIAVAVAEACSVEEQLFIALETQGYSYAMRARFEPKCKAKDQQLATMVVLKIRAGETHYKP